MYNYIDINEKVHRLIPSKFPPVLLFDWVESQEELEQIALLEGLTNDRILMELGHINLIARDDWVGGIGATPLMAAFTHIGFPSRFSDGHFGIYYAANSLQAAIRETVFHRERFYHASKESACAISMREYIAHVQKPLIDITEQRYSHLLHPDPSFYTVSQAFGKEMKANKEWGIAYPSIRAPSALCVAILRPPALTIPTQGCHLRYIWDGTCIIEVYQENKLNMF